MPVETAAAGWPAVGIVVINWHAGVQTRRCIEALAALTYPNWRLVLVENESREFSAAALAELAGGAAYLHSDENLGFAGACNLGMREALRGGADYVWFLNNDTRPEARSLDELVAVTRRDPARALVGAKILLASDPTRIDSVALHVDLRSGRIRLIGHGEVDRGQYDALSDPLAVTACALLVSRAACERLGGFDESFFAYLEDADLCLRARAVGFQVALAARARVQHDRPIATRERQSPASLYYTSRNHLYLLDRHGTGGSLRRALRRVFVVALNAAYCARLGFTGAGPRCRALWQGVRDHRRGVVGGPWQSTG